MYGIFTYIWVIYEVNVGKYTIHGWSGYVYTTYLQPVSEKTGSPVSEKTIRNWGCRHAHDLSISTLHSTSDLQKKSYGGFLKQRYQQMDGYRKSIYKWMMYRYGSPMTQVSPLYLEIWPWVKTYGTIFGWLFDHIHKSQLEIDVNRRGTFGFDP